MGLGGAIQACFNRTEAPGQAARTSKRAAWVIRKTLTKNVITKNVYWQYYFGFAGGIMTARATGSPARYCCSFAAAFALASSDT